MKPIIIAGPTASGKTSLGIQLAKRLGGAIISADSRMVYRGLDIGTGKPTWEHRQLDHSPWIEPTATEFGPVYSIEGIDHYGLDLVDPETPFTLTDWLAFARPLIVNLQRRSIQPIVVGGTGLYLRALINGFNPPATDVELRARIEARSDDELLDTLYEADPVSVSKVAGNRRRLVRAVEVLELTGRPISDPKNSQPLEAVIIAPQVDRVELYRRIDARLHERFAAGLIDEVHDLIKSGISSDWLESLGLEYRSITEFLTYEVSTGISHFVGEELLEEKLAGAIHRYARRQLTYLRHQLPVQWVNDFEEAMAILRSGSRE